MEWTVFQTVAAICTLFISIGVPIIRLNASITKLNVLIERTEKDVAANRDQIEEQRKAARESHKRLWDHSDKQDAMLQDHETRIKFLEKEKKDEDER